MCESNSRSDDTTLIVKGPKGRKMIKISERQLTIIFDVDSLIDYFFSISQIVTNIFFIFSTFSNSNSDSNSCNTYGVPPGGEQEEAILVVSAV